MATVHYGRLMGTSGFAKTVAIKRLHRALAQTEAFRKMILEEGRLAARVRHPNVVPPLDVLAEGGELLLVMEYVHGESLSRLLRSAWKAKERVPLPIGAAILSNVLHGLHAAHEARDEAGQPLGIVHRDVSPQNVIVGADGIARVIDFGIAKAVTSEEMTTAGTIKGKVPYLAPEQLEGEPATRRTDLYAAGVVLWEVLANKRLFTGADDGEVLRNIMTMKVQPPSAFNAVVPGAIDDVVLRAIARDPKARFDSARDMALAIEEAVHLATGSVVGTWAERLAADTLAERAARIAEVEATAPAAPSPALDDTAVAPGPGTVRMSAKEAGVPAPPPKRRSEPPPPGARASAPPMRPPTPSRPVVEPRTVIYEPPAMPAAPFVEGVRPIGAPPVPTERVSLPPPSSLPSPSFIPPSSHAAARQLTNVAKPSAAGSAIRRVLRYVALVVVLALVVAFMFAPAITRAIVVSSAAKRGVAVTIERVDVSRREIRLLDLRAESADLPGATLRAGVLVIGLRWLVPERITVDDGEITLDGSFTDVGTRVDAYRARHGAGVADALARIEKIEVTSGRIDWRNVAGAGTTALVENATFEATKTGGRAIGDDYRFSAPLLTMKLAGAPAGPWQIELDRQGALARSVLRFDPAGIYPASVTRTVSDDGTMSLSFSVPSTSLSDLHMPPALFGAVASSRSRLEVRGDVTIGASRALAGSVSFGATGLSIFPGAPPVNLSMPILLTGTAAQRVPIAGMLGVAPSDPSGVATPPSTFASMSGTLDLTGRVPRIELTGKSGAAPCTKPSPAAPPPPRGVRSVAPGNGVAVTVDVRLDDLTGAKVSFSPAAACHPLRTP